MSETLPPPAPVFWIILVGILLCCTLGPVVILDTLRERFVRRLLRRERLAKNTPAPAPPPYKLEPDVNPRPLIIWTNPDLPTLGEQYLAKVLRIHEVADTDTGDADPKGVRENGQW